MYRHAAMAALIGTIVIGSGCGSADGGDGPGVVTTIEGVVRWDPGAGTFSGATRDGSGALTSTPIDLLGGSSPYARLLLDDFVVTGDVARLRTRVENPVEPEGEMVDVTLTFVAVDGAQEAHGAIEPVSYGDIPDGEGSAPVGWTVTGVDPATPFTITFELNWRIGDDEHGPGELIVTGEYGEGYHLVDPSDGHEVGNPVPDIAGTVTDVTLGPGARRTYFSLKAEGAGGFDLYACDTFTGSGLQRLTHMEVMGLGAPAPNPIDGGILFSAPAQGRGTARLFLVPAEGERPVQLTGGEWDMMVVPGADDPTETWGDSLPAWSWDGARVAYVRASKDTRGQAVPMISAVVVMAPDGSSRRIVWAHEGEGVTDLCWTSDDEFLILTFGELGDQAKKVYAVHVASGEVSDLTAGFPEDPGVPRHLSCAPSSMALVFTQISVNPDLFEATLTRTGDHGLRLGEVHRLTSEGRYRHPSWRPAGRAPLFDAVGHFSNLPDDMDQVLVSGNYGDKYYLVDPEDGREILAVAPGVHGVEDVTLGYQGRRIYFLGKGAGRETMEIHGCDLLTGEHLVALTSFEHLGLGGLDASPVDPGLVFHGIEDGSKARIYLLDEEGGEARRLTGDESMVVPGADDPTVSWGDRWPVFSPDGSRIAYVRASKDEQGRDLPMVYAVVIMQRDGSDKVPVYGDAGTLGLHDLCFSHDGSRLFFLSGWVNAADKRLVSVDLETMEADEIDTHGLRVQHSWCAPTSDRLVLQPVDVNPDLYLVGYSAAGGEVTIEEPVRLTHGEHYRAPDWSALVP